jgi:hypothetical protein
VVAPEALREAALRLLEKAANGGLDWRARRALKVGPAPMPADPVARAKLFADALARIEQAAAPHQPAALAAAQMVQRGSGLNRTGAVTEESLAFAQIAKTQAAGSLVRAFLSSQVVKKLHKQNPTGAQAAAQQVLQRVLTAFMKTHAQLLNEGVSQAQIERALLAFGWAPGEPMRRAALGAAGATATPGGIASADNASAVSARADPLTASSPAPSAASLSDETITQRTLLPMVLEAVRVLEEGVVSSPAELDMALLAGMGWPAYLGGALHYADWLGLSAVVQRCDQYRAAGLGAAFEASKRLRELAGSGLHFYG